MNDVADRVQPLKRAARRVRDWLVPEPGPLAGRRGRRVRQLLVALQAEDLTQTDASALASELIALVEAARSEAPAALGVAAVLVAEAIAQATAEAEGGAADGAPAGTANGTAAGISERRLSRPGAAGDEAPATALHAAIDGPAIRLLMRLNAAPEGLRFLLALRASALEAPGGSVAHALAHPLEALFSMWFDVPFLELRRMTWETPAALLEKLIRYEAVHPIRSWDDLRNRLDSDRRCYAFFHPRVADEPLIFVEVALTRGMADNVAALLDEKAPLERMDRIDTATFYSISNTQKGLRGVSFGHDLLKRVMAALVADCPRVTHFATLSPIPGFRRWVQKVEVATLDAAQRQTVQSLRATDAAPDEALAALAAFYLTRLERGRPIDAVARFHLGNGARVERINLAADPSEKGRAESFGVMVNYRYEEKKLAMHRGLLQEGKVATGPLVAHLLRTR